MNTDNEYSDRRLFLQIKFFINRLYHNRNIKEHFDYNDYIDSICEFYEKPRSAVLSKCRKRELVIVRQITQTLLKQTFPMSLKQVGEIAGNVGHADVLHSMRTVKNLYQVDAQYQKRINKLLEQMGIERTVMNY